MPVEFTPRRGSDAAVDITGRFAITTEDRSKVHFDGNEWMVRPRISVFSTKINVEDAGKTDGVRDPKLDAKGISPDHLPHSDEE